MQGGKCLGFGRDTENCRKIEGKKKWVKKTVSNQEGFTKVATHKVVPVNTTIEILVHNNFMVLEEPGLEGMAEHVTENVSDAVEARGHEVVGINEIGAWK